MSEYRQDPLSRRWVIIGGERGGRPNEFVEAATRASDISCPFCAGHEAETPPPIASYSSNGKGKWLVRVVPNKFPAVTTETGVSSPGCLQQPASPDGSEVFGDGTRSVPTSMPGVFGHGTGSVPTTMPGFGSHEVIIESPRHVASLSDLTDAEAQAVFAAYRDRLLKLKAEGAYRYVQIFKNVGPAAGASLEHVHSQLVALPGVPEVIEQELKSCGEFFQQHKRSLLLDMLERETAAGDQWCARRSTLSPSAPMPAASAMKSGSPRGSTSPGMKM